MPKLYESKIKQVDEWTEVTEVPEVGKEQAIPKLTVVDVPTKTDEKVDDLGLTSDGLAF